MSACDVAELSRDVQRRLEALYALDSQPAVSDFLIPAAAGADLPGSGSRTLVSENEGELQLGVVLEEQVIESLSRCDPRVHLNPANVGPFCTLVEEVSHFAFLMFCAQKVRTVSQLELELQAEVDKYLNVAFLLSLQNEGAVSPRLKVLLFRQYRLKPCLSPEQAQRYSTASGLAYRYCQYLECQYLRPSRLPALRSEARRFYRLGQSGKLERIQACA